MLPQHYLSYLNNLRVNEYCSAVESLFHYFDRQHVAVAPAPASAAARTRPDSTTEQEAASRGLRYAALNLASLHYRFGHRCDSRRGRGQRIWVASMNGTRTHRIICDERIV